MKIMGLSVCVVYAILTGILLAFGAYSMAVIFGLFSVIFAIDGHCEAIKAALEK